MGKLQDMVSKAVKDAQSGIKTEVVKAASAGTKVDKPVGTVTKSTKSFEGSAEGARLAEVGMIVKAFRGGQLTDADVAEMQTKAVGITGATAGSYPLAGTLGATEFSALLPSGFTGQLVHDIQNELNVASLFNVRQISGGSSYDLIALYGIKAYLTNEATETTESSESYTNFVATTQKIMAKVVKSYELIDDSLIDLAAEVRSQLVRALAEAIEETVLNGQLVKVDLGETIDADDARLVSNGLRATALGKGNAVDFGGVTTEANFLAKVTAMSLAGGVYTDQRAIARGDVVLVIDDYTYGYVRGFEKYATIDKAGADATLFGGRIETVFDIPIRVTSQLPIVDATGIVSATGADNTQTSCMLINLPSFRLTANGATLSESEKVIGNQTYRWFTSFRYGFSSVYDSTQSANNTVVAVTGGGVQNGGAGHQNIVLGVNLARA